MLKKSMLLVALLLTPVATLAAAGDQTTPATVQIKNLEQGEHASFEGTLVCLGCSLKSEGARSQCSEFGHTHALVTEEGKYVNLLPNKYSADLLKGGAFHNKEVAMEGVYFVSANQLDVETYSVEGKRHGWCDHCKAMDGCAFAKKQSDK
jgi:hypothetical protein